MEKYQYNETELKLIENSCIPMAVYQFIDRRVVTVALSAGLCEMFGIDDMAEVYDLMDNDMYRDTHPEDIARISDAAYRFATEDGDYSVIYRSLKAGEYHIIRAFGRHIYKGDVRLAVVTYTDEGLYNETEDSLDNNIHQFLGKAIRERTRAYNNNYDYLTGLPDMTYFFELAEAGRKNIIDKGEKPVILFFDLSGMKSFNHKYGFSEGDRLIKVMSEILKKYLSNENCGRFGADHFAAFASMSGLEEKLKAILKEAGAINDGKNLPLRIGVYPLQDSLEEPSVACDRAKMACDSTKASYISGINYFDMDMLKKEENRQYVIENIDRAIENGWIKVFYQPIIRAANGRVSDEEALARWDDPVRGSISPGDFIPILEDSKLIYKLDMYVVERTIAKMKRQHEASLYVVPQSVNLSRVDFFSCDIVEEIRKFMDEAGIDRSKLTIEITESAVVDDISFIEEQVDRLHELGFKVWMDDYGSGYSSPEILQRIHFDTIKFDMQFMREFDTGEESRIILSELLKMAIALGIETVVEGVETREQADFLKEVGSSKLQGYFYCEPIPMEGILDRYRKGIQIGFENPDESDYYGTIGRVNMYDLTYALESDEKISRSYFNTIPMAIVEMDQEAFWIIRSNLTFREAFGDLIDKYNAFDKVMVSSLTKEPTLALYHALAECGRNGENVLMDIRMNESVTVHLFIRRIAVNPVTDVVAYAVVAIGMAEDKKEGSISFSDMAKALSTDYIYIYFIDLDTEKYVEYSTEKSSGRISVERHGEGFFKEALQAAKNQIYSEDLEEFRQVFSREKVLDQIKRTGIYTYSYRLILNGKPVYVHMKAGFTSANGVKNGLIIGVSNIDAQKKQQAAIERMKEEQMTYNRVAALSGDFVAIYAINPDTEEYYKYVENEAFKDIGIGSTGQNFFETFREETRKNIYLEDIDVFLRTFTKVKVLAGVAKNKVFTMNFRVMISGEPVYLNLKAAMISERGENQLLIGLINIDDQIKRDIEYANNLTAARNEANLDALTGVKNRHAYIDVEEQLDKLIEENKAADFAVVVCDINGLKEINDNFGHSAGDIYIKDGCELICDVFRHSPVFRVGGDEFVVIVQGREYKNIDKLMQMVENQNEENLKTGKVVVAAGMSIYFNDPSVAAVFERADSAMYANKVRLKRKKK